MTIKAVANRYFKELYRTKVTFILLFIFPFFFLFIFNIAFGTTNVSTPVTYQLIIVNDDTGVPSESVPFLSTEQGDIATNGFGNDLAKIIEKIKYDNTSEQYLFNVTYTNNETAFQYLNEERIDLVMHIPANFSLMILNRINVVYGNQSIPTFPTGVNATIKITGNDNNFNAPVAQSILSSVISSYMKGVESQRAVDNVDIQQNLVLEQEGNTIFDFIASGIFVFATILAASMFSAMLLNDWDLQTIKRIKLAPVTPLQYITGYMLIVFLFMQLQYIFLFLAADLIFGFTPVGPYTTGYFVLMLTSLATFALIFSAATLVDDAETVGSVLGFSSSILGFASNAFFQMPDVILMKDLLNFTSGSPDLLLWDLFPWTHAVNALRAIFLFDLSLQQISGDLALLIISSVLWLVLSLYFFIQKRFQQEVRT